MVPLHQLKTWATPRLLRYFKKCRKYVHINWFGRREDCLASDYWEEVRNILNSREHVQK